MPDKVLYPIAIIMGFFIRILPIRISLWFARRLGFLAYILYKKRRTIGYANIKAAFSAKMAPAEIKLLTRMTFQHFAQVLFEVFKFPSIDERYVDRYITCQGLNNVRDAIIKGRGAIALTAHFGNWELSGLAGAIKGYPQDVIARQQKHQRLNELLNSYRAVYGRHVYPKGMAIRDIISSLKANRVVAILSDQDAGPNGYLVNFFGRLASTPQGAVAFALKLDSAILPNFCIREKGQFCRLVVEPPLALEKTADNDADIQVNMQRFTDVLQSYITRYPEQWLWLHKRWKTTPSRRVLVISDAKAGHLNQAKAVAKQVRRVVFEKAEKDERVKALKASLRGSGTISEPCHSEPRRGEESLFLDSSVASLPQNDTFTACNLNDLIYQEKTIEAEYKSKFHKALLGVCSLFASVKCQGCLRCLRFCLKKDSYDELASSYADIIISCGSQTAPVSRFLSFENMAKNITVMKPGMLPVKKFTLCVIPRHDNPQPAPNTIVTDGALNLIEPQPAGSAIGLLIGGDNKNFILSRSGVNYVLNAAINISKKTDVPILLTTSRRTSAEIEDLIKEKLSAFDGCKMLIIANEKNPPDTMNKILSLSRTVIVSGESISMVSEAASSGKRVIVFEPQHKTVGARHAVPLHKHFKFLKNLEQKGYIILCKPQDIGSAFEGRLPLHRLDDSSLVYEAIKKIV